MSRPIFATDSPTSYRPGVLWAALLVFGIVDFSLAPLLTYAAPDTAGAIMACAAAGVALAQSILLAIYLVFGPGKFWERLAIHWSLAALAWLVWFVGYWWIFDFESAISNRAMPRQTFVLPVFSLALQTPLWLARCFTLRLANGAEVAAERPWSIADLLFGTTIVAVSLSAAMVGPPSVSTPLTALIRPTAFGLMLGGMVALPLSWSTLRVRSSWFAGLSTVLYSALFVTGTLTLVLVTGGAANIGLWIVVALGAAEVACLATVAGSLAIARHWGWRLTIGRAVPSTRSAIAEQPAA